MEDPLEPKENGGRLSGLETFVSALKVSVVAKVPDEPKEGEDGETQPKDAHIGLSAKKGLHPTIQTLLEGELKKRKDQA